MNKAHSLHLPGDLLDAALKVPDSEAKLEQFARTEIALHQFRKARYHPKTLRILAKAKKAAAGADVGKALRSAEVEEFLRICDRMVPKRS